MRSRKLHLVYLRLFGSFSSSEKTLTRKPDPPLEEENYDNDDPTTLGTYLPSEEDGCGTSIDEGQIVGGEETKEGELPFMALLGYVNKRGGGNDIKFKCGGTLINRQIVIYLFQIKLKNICTYFSSWFSGGTFLLPHIAKKSVIPLLKLSSENMISMKNETAANAIRFRSLILTLMMSRYMKIGYPKKWLPMLMTLH